MKTKPVAKTPTKPVTKAMSKSAPKTVDDYIAGFPPDIQTLLQAVRATVRKAAPKAEEAIKYAMPTYVLNGNMLSVGAYKTHIGVYPIPAGDAKFQAAVAAYKSGKSALNFPLNEPIPYTLITKLVKFRMKEMAAKPAPAKPAPAKSKR